MTLTASNNNANALIPERIYAEDPHCLEVLQFFYKHPKTRFSRLALAHSLNFGKVYVVDRALKRLVKDGLIILHADKIVALYSLAGENK